MGYGFPHPLESFKRFGSRVLINQPGQLQMNGRAILGVIENVGLRGVFFSAGHVPKLDTQGTLKGPDGKPIPVRVVWQRRGATPGVGLAFEPKSRD